MHIVQPPSSQPVSTYRLLTSTMTGISDVLSIIRSQISKLKIPGGQTKVYNDECMLSFDSPFSDTGLFVNMISYLGYGAEHYLDDSAKTNCLLYLHEKWTQIPVIESVEVTLSSTETENGVR